MDMRLSIDPIPLDVLLLMGAGLIVLCLGYLVFLLVVEKTRRSFRALQPALRITRSATMYSNGEDMLTIVLRNIGGSLASDIRATIHRGEGLEPTPVLAGLRPGESTQDVWVKVKSDSPLLHEKRDQIKLTIQYQDPWGHAYMLTHPVVQRESVYGWLALKLVEGGKVRVSRPTVPYTRMQKILKQVSRGKSVSRVMVREKPTGATTILAMRG